MLSSLYTLLLLFLTMLFSTPFILSSAPTIPTHNRRTLHQPFFPLLSSPSPPAQPPAAAPFPKYPSLNPRPFFPIYPSPPPPSPPLPSLPTNLSSLPAHPRSSSRNLTPLVALPATALALLVIALAVFLQCRRRRRSDEDAEAGFDSHRLFPPDATASEGGKPSASSAPTGSEFLYLGTLVNSRGHVDEPPAAAAAAAAAASSPYRKLDSPELRPLPPLSRQVRYAEGGCSSEEEFYSPSDASPRDKGSPGGLAGHPASSSQKTFPAAALGKCASPALSSTSSSDLVSSPSPSSPTASSPPISSSPTLSTIRSPTSRDPGFQPPPPPAPPRLLRPLTPSPPKRKPSSPFLPSSPPEKDSDQSSRISDFPGQNLHFPARACDFACNPFTVSPPPRRPPPPPPPPPPGYREANVPKMAARQPSVLPPPGPIGVKYSAAAVFPSQARENSEVVVEREHNRRPKLKPLHWDKVRASSDRAMVWDHLKSSSFQLNEEMIEALFVCEATNAATKGSSGQQASLSPNREINVIDPKKSQNIAILLRALNVTTEEVCGALLEGNADSLGNELLETLLKMAPSKEEAVRLKEYKDDSPFKLGPAEKFLKAVLDIPFAFKRLDAMLYIANFESESDYLRKSFESLELAKSQAACEELRSSRLFFKLLEAVLKTGNRMNVGTNRGDAQAFKLATLLKLVDVKGTDGKTTLLHFVVQEIIKAEGARFSAASPSTTKSHAGTSWDDLGYKKLGLQVVSRLGDELSNVKRAAGMDSDVLGDYVSKLAGGIGKISDALRLNNGLGLKEKSQRFHDAMNGFLNKAEDEIIKLQAQQRVAMSLVKEISIYFHGDSAKEEAHPFRIFMVVRDFLAVLDQVCKEVGRINERTTITSVHRHLPAPVHPVLPPMFPGLATATPVSSDDESLSSMSS